MEEGGVLVQELVEGYLMIASFLNRHDVGCISDQVL